MNLEYFQLIDRVESLDPAANRIQCRATVPTKSTIFEGHFPGYPLMPGVLIVESMAQTSGYLLLSLLKFERMPFLIQIQAAKLRTFVAPGEALAITATLDHEGSGFAATKARVERDGKPIADAELRFRTMPFPKPELRGMVRDYARAVGLPVDG
jgi:3-hydroxyacyl-[acyl-carrier-protein] dehydratase